MTSRISNDRPTTPVGAQPAQAPSTAPFEINYGLSLGELFGVIRKRLWVIALVTLGLMGAAIGFGLIQTPVYEGSIVILIGQEEPTDNAGQLQGEIAGLQQITQTMVEGVASRPIANAVIERLGLQTTPGEVQKNLRAEQIGATQFIKVDYIDASPEEAQRIANTVGEVFSEQVSEVSPSASSIRAEVWQWAEVPDKPVSPKPRRDGLIALAVGVLLGVALAFLLEHLDDRWGSFEEVERILKVPAFGAIPEYKVPRGKE